MGRTEWQEKQQSKFAVLVRELGGGIGNEDSMEISIQLECVKKQRHEQGRK
jgi:hypothetical protein